MPRADPATAGKRRRKLTTATRMMLAELYPDLMRPLVGTFGWERGSEMTLKFAMRDKETSRA